MQQSEEQLYKQFFMHLRHLTWVHVLYLYDETHLLITDSEMADYLNGARKEKLRCQIASPAEYRAAITPDIRKVLVMCENGELRVIRALQAEFPDLHVTSGTYGYMRTGRDRYPRMVKFDRALTLPKAQPVVFLSTPYADAELITKALAENGAPFAHEFLGRYYASWLQLHRPFQVSRFYSGVEKKYAKEGQLYYLLQTDVMTALFENTAFKMRHFIKYLHRMDAKVVFIHRKDRLTQAAIAHLLDKTGERSVWTKKLTKKLNTPLKKSACMDSFGFANAIGQGAEMLDNIRAANLNAIDITVEDFATNQEAEMKRIAAFLDVELSEEIKTLPYADAYKATPALHAGADKVRREMLDRLGLHV